jgi:hypothetical protein
MTTLTHEAILELLSTTKQRGVKESTIAQHVASGELALNVSELPTFKGKDIQGLSQGFKQTIASKGTENSWPTLTVLIDRTDKDNKQVILVNMDVLAKVQAGTTDDDEN